MIYKKNRKTPTFRLLLIMVLTAGMSLCVKADPGDPGDPDTDPDAVPLDPGSWVLVAAGLGYGVKKWRDSKHKSDNINNNNNNTSDFIIKDK
jgi:hypothetical protein